MNVLLLRQPIAAWLAVATGVLVLSVPPRAAGQDSLAAQRDRLMNQVLQGIAGREDAPAESVFKNLRVLRGMPAGRIPRIMNIGFARSLGVTCDYCHLLGEWERDDKPKKEITRRMWEMMSTINNELLARIQGLQSPQPAANCTTCHRGAIKPALNLPPP